MDTVGTAFLAEHIHMVVCRWIGILVFIRSFGNVDHGMGDKSWEHS